MRGQCRGMERGSRHGWPAFPTAGGLLSAASATGAVVERAQRDTTPDGEAHGGRVSVDGRVESAVPRDALFTPGGAYVKHQPIPAPWLGSRATTRKDSESRGHGASCADSCFVDAEGGTALSMRRVGPVSGRDRLSVDGLGLVAPGSMWRAGPASGLRAGSSLLVVRGQA